MLYQDACKELKQSLKSKYPNLEKDGRIVPVNEIENLEYKNFKNSELEIVISNKCFDYGDQASIYIGQNVETMELVILKKYDLDNTKAVNIETYILKGLNRYLGEFEKNESKYLIMKFENSSKLTSSYKHVLNNIENSGKFLELMLNSIKEYKTLRELGVYETDRTTDLLYIQKDNVFRFIDFGMYEKFTQKNYYLTNNSLYCNSALLLKFNSIKNKLENIFIPKKINDAFFGRKINIEVNNAISLLAEELKVLLNNTTPLLSTKLL